MNDINVFQTEIARNRKRIFILARHWASQQGWLFRHHEDGAQILLEIKPTLGDQIMLVADKHEDFVYFGVNTKIEFNCESQEALATYLVLNCSVMLGKTAFRIAPEWQVYYSEARLQVTCPYTPKEILVATMDQHYRCIKLAASSLPTLLDGRKSLDEASFELTERLKSYLDAN